MRPTLRPSDLDDLFGDLTLRAAMARRGYLYVEGYGFYESSLYRRTQSGRVTVARVRPGNAWQYLARVELKLAALLRVPACFYCGFPITGDCGKYDTLPPDECASCFERHVEAAMAHINNPER